MNSLEIDHILSSLEETKNAFLGVFPCDKLPNLSETPLTFCIVVNLSTHDEKGSHWCIFYRHEQNDIIYYFDSFGMPPYINELIDFIHGKKFWYSVKTVQHPLSQLCGFYVIAFAIAMCNGLYFADFLKLFTNDYKKNDVRILKFLKNVLQYKLKNVTLNKALCEKCLLNVIHEFSHI